MAGPFVTSVCSFRQCLQINWIVLSFVILAVLSIVAEIDSVEPYFTFEPKSMDVDEGETIKFKCEAYGHPEPIIQWFHNSKLIEEASHNPRLRKTKNSISITNVTREDNGSYACKATNNFGYVNKDFYVNVQALAPEITEPPRDERAVNGKTLNMTCRAYGVPKPRVKWVRDAFELTGDRYKIFENGNFQISDVNFQDEGKYTCVAENKIGAAKATGSLTVIGDDKLAQLGPDYKVLDGKVLVYDDYRDYSTDRLYAKNPSFYEYDFDPVYLEELLISIAFAAGTTPKQYQNELELLVGSIGTNRLKSQKIRDLEQKYNVSSLPDTDPEGEGYSFPDTITPTRLTLLFPHYFRFDLAKLNRLNFNPACRWLDEILPKITKYPEFAGLIPTADSGLKREERRPLVGTFLIWQFCNADEAERSDESLIKMASIVQKRIQASRLPNRSRWMLLKEKHVLNCSETIQDCKFPKFKDFPPISEQYLSRIIKRTHRKLFEVLEV